MFSRLLRSDKLFLHRNTNLNNPAIKFEFDADNLKLAKNIIAQYPVNYEKAAMIPLLDLAQRQNGFLSISCMNYVASFLKVPPMRAYEVASFYTMFNREPIGKYHIQVCTTSPCELCGSTKIVDAIKKHLNVDFGETTKDNLFTLSSVECAGACVNAPVMAVNDDYFEDLNEETTISILDALKSGKGIAKLGKKAKADEIQQGPQKNIDGQRFSCEPKGGLTSLTEEPYGPGFAVRSDL